MGHIIIIHVYDIAIRSLQRVSRTTELQPNSTLDRQCDIFFLLYCPTLFFAIVFFILYFRFRRLWCDQRFHTISTWMLKRICWYAVVCALANIVWREIESTAWSQLVKLSSIYRCSVVHMEPIEFHRVKPFRWRNWFRTHVKHTRNQFHDMFVLWHRTHWNYSIKSTASAAENMKNALQIWLSVTQRNTRRKKM